MLARASRLLLPPLLVALGLVAFRLLTAALVPAADFFADLPAPRTISPRYDDPRVVTDQQLVAVLERVKPPTGQPNTNNMLHALRLWGPEADFFDPQIPTGPLMRQYFLDDAVFQRLNGPQTPPLFTLVDGHIQVRSWQNRDPDRTTSSYHQNDLLATLAETGVTVQTPLVTRNGASTVGALLQDTMRDFHLNQQEYEWSTISYARYLFPRQGWRNQYGERMDLDGIVAELIEPPLHFGPCNGLHRLEAMAVLYRADEQAQAIPPQLRQRMLRHMGRVSSLLIAAQSPAGYWTRQWPTGAAAADDAQASMLDRILVTGHHLEWLALAPENVQPPRETIVRAAQWLVRAMEEEDPERVLQYYGPYTHAARALCLWRSRDPYQAWQAHPANQPKQEE